MEARTTSTTLTARLPILNPGEYDLWLMRIEQYFLMTNYSLWEVILNEEKQDRRNEIKARGTLLMALPNKDQLKFHSYKDAKLLMEAIIAKEDQQTQAKIHKMWLLCPPTALTATATAAQMKQITLLMELEIHQEDRAPRNQENRGRENSRRIVTVETPTENALVAQDGIGGSSSSDSKENNKSKSDKGCHTVPPPYTENFIPSKPDLTFIDEIVKSENVDVITVVTPSNVKKVESNHESADVKNNGDAVEPKTVRKNSLRPLVIKDWNSNDDSEVEFIPKDKTVRPSTEKIKFVKSARETIEKVETPKQNNTILEGSKETGTILCPKD
ncbi:hypothetical protein Tco_0071812 [Tanacetum coccineum]